ncbi:MAG: hypothetical protein ACFCUX_04145 [Candidatus Methylacidiphilales bacterium]
MRRCLIVMILMGGMGTGCEKKPEVALSIPEPVSQVESQLEAEVEKKPAPAAREFSVLVYNVENLFDLDQVALFDDYASEIYTSRHFLTKLRNTAEMIMAAEEGRGPDIVLLQECEGDQTPGDWSGNVQEELGRLKQQTLEQWLGDVESVPQEVRGLPSYVWLLAALAEAGADSYQMVVADYIPPASANQGPVHVNVVLSRFPVIESKTHHLVDARSILEVVLDVEGHPFRLFNNHWKSGASRPETEIIRVGNAKVLRQRLDVLLHENPLEDILIGGDLNSHYNHSALYPDMKQTGIQHILGSHGNERLMVQSGSTGLYNLWFELPFEQRGSELYRGRWGTLMHIILAPGLYHRSGIQYVDNSFNVIRQEGKNTHPVTGAPLAWSGAGEGSGFSDHFPVIARFRTQGAEQADFIILDNPSEDATGPADQPKFDYTSISKDAVGVWDPSNVPNAQLQREFFWVDGIVEANNPFTLRVGEQLFGVWSHDAELREHLFGSFPTGSPMRFIGELGRHRGNWQFVIHDESWISGVSETRP